MPCGAFFSRKKTWLIFALSVVLLPLVQPSLQASRNPCEEQMLLAADVGNYSEAQVTIGNEYFKLVEQFLSEIDRLAADQPSIYAKIYASEEFRHLPRIRQLYHYLKETLEEVQMWQFYPHENKEEQESLAQIIEGKRDELRAHLSQLQSLLLDQMMRHTQDSIVLEISAGPSGSRDDAEAFVEQQFRMYEAYAKNRGWKFEVVSVEDGNRGTKSVLVFVDGPGAGILSLTESGLHRFEHKKNNGTHTQHVAVAAYPRQPQTSLDLPESDFDVRTTRSQGPGGQNVNKLETAVEVIHTPTGERVRIQDTSSQGSNRERAFEILRARLTEAHRQRLHEEEQRQRRAALGLGDSAQNRIRTYDHIRSEVVDQRTNSRHSLAGVNSGQELGPLMNQVLLLQLEAQLAQDIERLKEELEQLREENP